LKHRENRWLDLFSWAKSALIPSFHTISKYVHVDVLKLKTLQNQFYSPNINIGRPPITSALKAYGKKGVPYGNPKAKIEYFD